MAEGKKLRLSVTGIQYPPSDGKEEQPAPWEAEQNAVVTRLEADAEYYNRQGTHYFIYEERPEGCSAPVRSRIKCREGILEMTRHGGMESRMIFEPGKKHRAEYPTPYGKLLLDIVTDRVTLEPGDPCPRITVEYILENAGGQMGVYRLILQASRRPSPGSCPPCA